MSEKLFHDSYGITTTRLTLASAIMSVSSSWQSDHLNSIIGTKTMNTLRVTWSLSHHNSKTLTSMVKMGKWRRTNLLRQPVIPQTSKATSKGTVGLMSQQTYQVEEALIKDIRTAPRITVAVGS